MINELIPLIDTNEPHVHQWSRVHRRIFETDGCVVDLGSLDWEWSSSILGKKRVIGVDPQGTPNDKAELFKGAILSKSGKATLYGRGIGATCSLDENGSVVALSWDEFCEQYKIDKISVLKINIEGGEYDILLNFDVKQFDKIDQIAVSFHCWLNRNLAPVTQKCIDHILAHNYTMIDLGVFGWKLFIKNK